MNPAQLLAHFDRISEAPDAIPRLRHFILDLAVRGKLVEQNPNDEPAGELLKRIETCAISSGKKRKTGKKNVDISSKANENWPIPVTWIYVPLERLAGETGLFVDGDWVESKDQDPNGGVRLIQLADVGKGEYRNRSSRFMNMETAQRLNCTFLSPDDILIARMPDPLGRACIFPGDDKPSVTVVDVAILRPENSAFDSKYVVHTINSSLFARNVEEKAAGTTRSRISRGNLGRLPFPLPPLPEQHRIVAKVDELMALCDQLKAAKAERESQRDRLIAASLHHLNSSADADASREHARFYLNHLPRLTTRPEHIKQLRQTILNLAVRGRLVPQDPNDEPAAELLKWIQKQKAELIKSGEIRKEKLPLPIANNILPFTLPSAWEWTKLGSLAKLITSGSRDWASYYADEGAIFVRMGNLSRDSYNLRLNHIQRVKPPDNSEGARTRLEEGDILISITGEVGLLGLIPPDFGEAYINQHICVVRIMPNYQNQFFPEFFRSAFAQEQFNAPQRGIKNSFRLTDVTELLVPIPPLAEQHRIVAKVDELMALCDQLEAQLTTTQANSRRLLETMLHRALGEHI